MFSCVCRLAVPVAGNSVLLNAYGQAASDLPAIQTCGDPTAAWRGPPFLQHTSLNFVGYVIGGLSQSVLGFAGLLACALRLRAIPASSPDLPYKTMGTPLRQEIPWGARVETG